MQKEHNCYLYCVALTMTMIGDDSSFDIYGSKFKISILKQLAYYTNR